MKLYFDPLSTSSRPVMLLIHDFGLDIEEITVNLHLQENVPSPTSSPSIRTAPFPVLDDDGFVLTESSAILKYLALEARPARLSRHAGGADPRGRDGQLVQHELPWLSLHLRAPIRK